ncbi:sentrin-specific protease 1-like isoform X2 [Ostrea edulis]|uniref:sentrin-specific protease 1-like isoform X2 n=1 Tax=Ostrea edulis TaxID=37623 RepID=UPI0024AEA5FF|nr:sentrin-specific protease 1-like isoform X2 [Ostrea edulis]
MIKSFTSKIKTFVFSDRSGDNNVTEGRKRKRDISEGEEEDVIVTSVKRARKVGPHTSALNYFNTLIVNPYQKMAEWMQRRKPWSEHYFFKRALSKDEAPNRDPGIVHSTTEDPLTVGNPPAMTKHVVGVTDGFKLPREGVKLTGNGHQSHNLPVGVPDVAARWTEDRHTSNLTSHPAPMRSPTQSNSNTVPSLSQSNHTSTSVQTDHSDLWLKVRECDVARLSHHSDKSLFSRPPRQTFTAIECVRLDEKKKYQQLLQQFTKFPQEKSSRSPDGLGASHLLHYGSRTEGSLSGSNSSIELCSVGRQPSVRRQKVVPTQKTRIPTPPRNTDYDHQRSPRQHSTVSHRQSLVSERWDSISERHDKSESEEDVICLSDEGGEDVICLLDDDMPVGNGRTPVRSQLDSSRTSESRHSRVSAHRSPGSPDFQSSKYLSEEWMLRERQFSRANREAQRKIEETEIKKKFYEEKHLKKDLLLERQVRQRLRLYDAEPAAVEDLEVEEEEEEQEETFPELTDEMLQVVNDALRPQPADEVLVEGYKLQIRRHDMESLAGLNWLNDEIINFYMNQLVERGETEGKPKVYAFNTFFYPKVMSQGHSSVKRWTRRVDIFSKDYILIPVHLGMHWCLAVIDFKKKMIRYFDSMGGNNMACLNALKEYLCAESLDKKKQKFDLTDWKTKIVKDIPQQMNGSDCGMFTCKFAEYITREADINFTQEHMPYFRKRMVYEIVRKKLLQ